MIRVILTGALLVVSVVGGLISMMRRAEPYIHFKRTSWIFLPLVLAVVFFVFVLPRIKRKLPKKKAASVTLMASSFFAGSLLFGFFLTKKAKKESPLYALSARIKRNKKRIKFADLQAVGIKINDPRNSSLHELITLNDPDLLPLLDFLIKKCNTEYLNRIYGGDTPLSLAARVNNIEAIKRLLKRSDIDLKKMPFFKKFGANSTPLDVAINSGNRAAALLLATEYDKRGMPIYLYQTKQLNKFKPPSK